MVELEPGTVCLQPLAMARTFRQPRQGRNLEGTLLIATIPVHATAFGDDGKPPFEALQSWTRGARRFVPTKGPPDGP